MFGVSGAFVSGVTALRFSRTVKGMEVHFTPERMD